MNNLKTIQQLKVILVKSGSTELDDQGRISGSLDLPLSDSGREEASQLAGLLEGLDVKAVHSAACLAAQQTGRLIAKACGKSKLRVEESWVNLDHGLWHGRCLEEVKENAPKFYRQWQEHPESICPPGGETFAEVIQRCQSAVERLLRKRKSGTVVVVAPQPLLGILEQVFESSQTSDSDFELNASIVNG